MTQLAQIDRVAKVFTTKAASKSPGLSVKDVATKAKIPYESVSKRVHDLRLNGWNIYTNKRAGETFYRSAE